MSLFTLFSSCINRGESGGGGFPGFKKPLFAILIFLDSSLRLRDTNYCISCVLFLCLIKLYDAKPFSGRRKCEISGACPLHPHQSPVLDLLGA